MSNHTTETLSEHNLAALAALMADNHEFAAKLADVIAEKLDKKFGWRQGELTSDFEKIEGRFKALDNKIDHMQTGIDTLVHNREYIDKGREIFESRTTRTLDEISRRLESIDGHLGIDSKRRPA